MKVPIFGIARHRIPIDGEGVTTLVTFNRCPLKCAYCLNPQCEDENPKQYTPKELMDIVKVDNLYFLATGGGVTFGGGEPCLRSEFIRAFKALANQHPDAQQWRLTIETSIAVAQHHIERLIPIIDQWIIDVKDMHPDIYENYTKVPIDRILNNLRLLAERGLQDRCLIRVPLIPEYNTPEKQQESCELLRKMGFEHFDVFEYRVK